MIVISIIGTRPEIIKMAPLIPRIDATFEHVLVHTGQHYDYHMSEVFFKELGLRRCDFDLNVGSYSPPKQIGSILIRLDEVIQKVNPQSIIVLGDTNSSLAGALAASKHKIPIIHIESGLRSFDKMMPEEINRVVIDHMSETLFAPSKLTVKNLGQEGISKNVFMVGNTIVDACLKSLPAASESKVYERFGLGVDDYVVITLHREANTEEKKLRNIVQALTRMPKFKFIFPIHPRTRQKLTKMNLSKKIVRSKNVCVTTPLSYLNFLCLLKNSRFVLTDSGGIQEEAITIKVPCLTLRENTERWETVHLGANKLIGTEPKNIINETRIAWHDREWKKRVLRLKNPYGDGKSAERIIERLKEST